MSVELYGLRAQVRSQVDLAAITKTANQLTGFRIDCQEVWRPNRQDAFVASVTPISNAPGRGTIQRLRLDSGGSWTQIVLPVEGSNASIRPMPFEA